MKLEGTVAVVTGAGQGIGRAIALTLAREGAGVVAGDIDLSSAQKVADEIKALARPALAIKADVAMGADVNQLARQTLETFGRVDILVNNAGIDQIISVRNMTEAQWDAHMDVNLKGPFLCSQAFGEHMIKQKYGRIINIASVVVHRTPPGQAAYGASKAGVIILTRVLAIEWARYNINVNSVSPGMVRTPLIEKAQQENPRLFDKWWESIPKRRFIEPGEIANAVLFLASPEADAITGANLVVDGGASAIWSY